MTIKLENSLYWNENDCKSRVFQIIPDCHGDNRGYFMEVFKEQSFENPNIFTDWTNNSSWIKQINRSSSSPGVVRGCHAQRGKYCQGKMVEALNERIYDIITDARPDSTTFGANTVFLLDPKEHNMLWVPRGFLHSFVVPSSSKGNAIFQYICDNVYDRDSEVGVNPSTLLPGVISKFKDIMHGVNGHEDLFSTFENDVLFSEKDKNAVSYDTFMSKVMFEYTEHGTLWYK